MISIEDIIKKIRKNTKLKWLHFNGRYDDTQIQILGKVLSEASALEELTFANNELGEYSAAQIQTLGNVLSEAPSMTTVKVSGLGMWHDVQIRAFGKLLFYIPKLEVLRLDGNDLGKYNVARIEMLGNALCQAPNLTSLGLGNNQLNLWDKTCIKAFGNVLKQMPKLKVLALSSNVLDKWDKSYMQALSDALSGASRLTTLDFSLVAYFNRHLLSIPDFSGISNLTSLNLSRNGLGDWNITQIQTLRKQLTAASKLATLILDNNRLALWKLGSIEEFGKILRQMPALASLSICEEELDYWDNDRIQAFGKALSGASGLTNLSLYQNRLPPKSLDLHVFSKMQRLTSLDLRLNHNKGLSDLEFYHFFNELKKNQTLTSFQYGDITKREELLQTIPTRNIKNILFAAADGLIQFRTKDITSQYRTLPNPLVKLILSFVSHRVITNNGLEAIRSKSQQVTQPSAGDSKRSVEQAHLALQHKSQASQPQLFSFSGLRMVATRFFRLFHSTEPLDKAEAVIARNEEDTDVTMAIKELNLGSLKEIDDTDMSPVSVPASGGAGSAAGAVAAPIVFSNQHKRKADAAELKSEGTSPAKLSKKK